MLKERLKSPSTKIILKKPLIQQSRAQTPQKNEKINKPSHHKHTFSTPLPYRSPCKTKPNSIVSKASQPLLGFKKIDLRKGIFSNKQIFLKNPMIMQSPTPVPKVNETPLQSARQNRYHVLSKEFKIDKKLFIPKKIESKDNEGFYIPDKPPLMHEDNNI